ncbi:unnamed protein product, partial [Meganyctiphanes norvegica]
RCVDYTGTARIFSVYAFECPQFHVFILDGDNSTCIPGTECLPGVQTAAHVTSPTQGPSGTTSATVDIKVPFEDSASSAADDGMSTSRPVQTAAAPVTSPPVNSVPVTSAEPMIAQPQQTPAPPVMECRGQYVQHSKYCNVYYKCSNSVEKFVCPAGSVFDTVRQMCRIHGADEDLCGGKSIYSSSLGLRYAAGVSVEPLGRLVHPESLISLSPRHYLHIHHSQSNSKAYFNPVLINKQPAPGYYIQPFATQFTQTVLPQPAPENVHPRMDNMVSDGKSRVLPEPEMVHPRQYYIPIDSELNADADKFY